LLIVRIDWKQTVFYLQETVAVNVSLHLFKLHVDLDLGQAGDMLQGTIQVGPNAKNPRDLDISIEYKTSGSKPPQSESLQYHM
jgi:protein arginine N-methyltransferase 1